METALRQTRHFITTLIAHKPRGFWLGFTAGIIWFGYIFSWLWSAYPLSYFGIMSPVLALVILLGIFAISVSVNALIWGIGAYLIVKASRKIDPIALPLVIAATFTLGEYIRAWLYGIVSFGPGTILGAHWTFGNIAYFTHPMGLIAGTASVWGIYGIDFGIAFFVAAGVMLVQRRLTMTQFRLPSAIGIALIICVYAVGTFRHHEAPAIPITILQTQKPTYLTPSQHIILDDFQEKAQLLDEALGMPESENGFIIFPEGSDFSTTLAAFLDAESFKKYFQPLETHSAKLIENIKVMESGEGAPRSRAIVIDGKEGVVASYDKKILTPIGEFMPYIVRGIIWPFKYFLAAFSSARGLTPGHGSNAVTIGDQTFTMLICSDLASPDMARNQGSQFIVAMNSLGVFYGNALLESQTLAMARMRAWEEGKYLVLASNSGHSFIIDAHGTVTHRSTEIGYKILTGDIVPNDVSTWYNQLGDWPILLFCLAILWYFRQHIFS